MEDPVCKSHGDNERTKQHEPSKPPLMSAALLGRRFFQDTGRMLKAHREPQAVAEPATAQGVSVSLPARVGQLRVASTRSSAK